MSNKSNSKFVSNSIKDHILACVYDENEQKYTTLQDACNALHSDFQRVSNFPYNLQKFPINQQRFSDYLQGLPYNFHFTYDSLKEFLDSLDLNNKSNKSFDLDQMIKLYHGLIYREVSKMIK